MLTFNDIKEKINAEKQSNAKAIIDNLKTTKEELDTLTKNINYVTDPILLNQLIFQMKAAEVRYQYWFCMAKNQKITSRLTLS